MRFSLPTLSAAAALIAQNPEIGLESNVFMSANEVVKLGTIKTDAAGAITWTPRPGASYGTGLDVHVSLKTAIVAASAPVITLTATIATVGAGTVAGTLAIPAWAANQNQFYPEGYALDLIPQGTGNDAQLITAIAGVTSLANIPVNSELVVWGSPLASNFVEIGWKKTVDGSYATPGTVSIANKYNPSAAIKKGRHDVTELKMDFNHISSMDGVARYTGLRTTALVKIIKDDAVTTEHIVYIGYRPNASPTRGEGNNEVVESSSGPVEACIRFVAN